METATTEYEDILSKAASLRWKTGPSFHDSLVEAIYTDATQIADRVVTQSGEKPRFGRRSADVSSTNSESVRIRGYVTEVRHTPLRERNRVDPL